MDAAAVSQAIGRPERWQVLQVDRTTSTNDELARGSARLPAPADGMVLVTEEQTAGRGRAGRQWSCPFGAGLMFSVLIAASGIPPEARAWTGVALGLAIVRAFDRQAAVRTTLKWPNDVMIGDAKCGGILAEAVGGSVVVGAGLNISLRTAELPRPDATSLLLAGAGAVDRNELLAAVLDGFGDLLELWRAAGGDVERSGLRPGYLACCSTLGRIVSVELPDGAAVTGLAIDVEPSGAIVIDRGAAGRHSYSAGDVVHLRTAAG